MVTLSVKPCEHQETILMLLKIEGEGRKLWGYRCGCGEVTEVYRTITVAGKDRVIL